jgi:DNA repair exonuclease SbcCD ATPase subunit
MADFAELEEAHQTSLEELYGALKAKSRDPQTSSALREEIIKRLPAVEDQLEQIQADTFHEGTVDLQAAADGIAPALQQLEDLKVQLKEVAKDLGEFSTIAGYVDMAISTCKALVG